ncbi:MAG: hypothetical protein E7487_02360 [Ruminococcaceae bacterium]|nr:hypothetical protein [Oscillospiraceae bacterium]
MKLLFIGNSYTFYHNMPVLLENLLRENGYAADIFSVTRGGRKLIENTATQDECSLQLNSLLQDHFFDVVFLQEQSLLSILDYRLFVEGVTALAEKLAPHTSKMILYATWGRREGSPDLDSLGLSSLVMTEKISSAYERAASLIHASVSPVGMAFAELQNDCELYAEDFSHPSYIGSCLAAVIHYTTVLGMPPQKCSSLLLPPEITAKLIETASHYTGRTEK